MASWTGAASLAKSLNERVRRLNHLPTLIQWASDLAGAAFPLTPALSLGARELQPHRLARLSGVASFLRHQPQSPLPWADLVPHLFLNAARGIVGLTMRPIPMGFYVKRYVEPSKICDLVPSPGFQGVKQGFRNACVALAERHSGATECAPCKGARMGVL